MNLHLDNFGLTGCLLLLVQSVVWAQDATVFKPIQPQKEVRATEIQANLTINGHLDEADLAVGKTHYWFFSGTA